MAITFNLDLEDVDWEEIKEKVSEDHFDNGRTPKQLKASFENSFATCIAYDGEQIIGKARALSDGVCNAYILDVWTYSPYRSQCIASEMMQKLFKQLTGQHVYLFTDDTMEFYENLGFKQQSIGMGKVVGKWLESNPKY
ncbi:MAG: GNAT family N-acetyltransferase [Anaerolineales bacterium]|nr:GNAT family N-acetyltransferase [Chloroflexota bacterium]MBL6981864.1 GNAT family N-acetyltransferase [Anaerolineales bacterium]